MVDAALRLLSLLNQLDYCQKSVTLDFQDGENGVMGYLDRMGFFNHLSQRIKILPFRPVFSRADIYEGTNPTLVEIAKIHRNTRDNSLPTRLTDALMTAYGFREDAK